MIYLNDYNYTFLFFVAGIVSVLFTSIYSLRLLVYVFHRKTQADEKVLAHVHESPLIMILPLIILSIFAIFLVCLLIHFLLISNIYLFGQIFYMLMKELIQTL